MAKSFFEVFPQLKLDTDLHGMLDDATVSKVSTTRQRNSLRIYLGCGRLLPKEKIYFLESELKRQLFPHHTMNIKIIEHFQLSEQYTLKNLLDVYWSSILTEFHRYSLLEYNLLRQAKVDVVEENTLRISLEDSVLAHQKEEEIYHILEKIFNERCNLSAQIQMEFHEKKESKYRKMQISRCRMKWKMSFVCPVLVQNVILKENIWRVRKQVHRKYHGRPGRLLQSLRRKQLRQRRRKLRRPKRKPCQQERSLQNRKNTVVSERILAAAGISGSGVLLNVLTIRM